VPLNRELVKMFQAMPRGLPAVPVFTYRGKPFEVLRKGLKAACQKGIEDFTFHDLRHTFINDWRQEGHDYFRIMAATGHKTLSVFKRDNTVSKDELKALVRENW
jgi:integrase